MISRVLMRGGAALLVLLLLAVGASLAMARPRPATGEQGPAAEALTRQLEEAVHMQAWEQTGAVAWTFAGHDHLWDRERGLSRVRWGRVEVLQRTDQRVGRVFRGGREIHGERRERLVQKAWSMFVNDRFWLHPFGSLRDDAVVRSVIDWEGTPALLVEYGSGGVTPGDAYLWLLDAQGQPHAWRMWVQILPIGGLQATWEGWTELPTGARVATQHRTGPATMKLDVRAAATLDGLEPGADPFDQLLNW